MAEKLIQLRRNVQNHPSLWIDGKRLLCRHISEDVSGGDGHTFTVTFLAVQVDFGPAGVDDDE